MPCGGRRCLVWVGQGESCPASRVLKTCQVLPPSRRVKPKTGFLSRCRRCNRPKPGFYAIAGVAIVQNRVFIPLQALQSPKTGFLCHCRRCNRPKPGFYAIAGIAIAQNRVFTPLQALQSSKTGFLCHCRHCNRSESDSGGFARSAMA